MKIYDEILAFIPSCEQERSDRELMLRALRGFDDVWTRENPIAHMTASAWVVDPAHTRAIMAYHNIYDSWAWLGGHADGMEDLLAVARKEVLEESGVQAEPISRDIFSLEVLPVTPHIKRGKFVSAHLHLNVTYLLQADPRQPLHEKPDENSAVRWFDFSEVLAHTREAMMRPIYQKLMDQCSRL